MSLPVNSRFLLLGFCALAVLCPAQAQERIDNTPGHQNPAVGGPKYKKDKAAKVRDVKGTVTDEAGRPLDGALVTLKDLGTNEKLTFITKQDGRYHFDELSFTKDYELSAQSKTSSSTTHRVSQYDRTPEIVRMLEVASNDTSHVGDPKK